MNRMNGGFIAENRLCYQRELRKNQRIHRRKVQNMRPTSSSNNKCTLDNANPRPHAHLRYNPKREQMEEERLLQIER